MRTKFNKGYGGITVELQDWDGDDLARKLWEYGRFYNEFEGPIENSYDPNNPQVIEFIERILKGQTNPKYLFDGTHVQFALGKISRICLAQVTRDKGIFASETHGIRPLDQDHIIPLSVAKMPDLYKRLENIQHELEVLYDDMYDAGIPALEARYVGLHSQTISVVYRTGLMNFKRSCFTRTNTNFTDELNYVYRRMWWELKKAVKKLTDPLSIMCWEFMLEKCIDDKPTKRILPFGNDFSIYTAKVGVFVKEELPPNTPMFDWRKSAWKYEMERMHQQEPWLLTELEKSAVEKWMLHELSGEELYTNYNGGNY